MRQKIGGATLYYLRYDRNGHMIVKVLVVNIFYFYINIFCGEGLIILLLLLLLQLLAPCAPCSPSPLLSHFNSQGSERFSTPTVLGDNLQLSRVRSYYCKVFRIHVPVSKN